MLQNGCSCSEHSHSPIRRNILTLKWITLTVAKWNYAESQLLGKLKTPDSCINIWTVFQTCVTAKHTTSSRPFFLRSCFLYSVCPVLLRPCCFFFDFEARCVTANHFRKKQKLLHLTFIQTTLNTAAVLSIKIIDTMVQQHHYASFLRQYILHSNPFTPRSCQHLQNKPKQTELDRQPSFSLESATLRHISFRLSWNSSGRDSNNSWALKESPVIPSTGRGNDEWSLRKVCRRVFNPSSEPESDGPCWDHTSAGETPGQAKAKESIIFRFHINTVVFQWTAVIQREACSHLNAYFQVETEKR